MITGGDAHFFPVSSGDVLAVSFTAEKNYSMLLGSPLFISPSLLSDRF
jgi:hypothetical protein